MPVQDLVFLGQPYGRRLAIERAPRVVVDLPAGPAYVEHVFLSQCRVLVEDGNYCPLEKAMTVYRFIKLSRVYRELARRGTKYNLEKVFFICDERFVRRRNAM